MITNLRSWLRRTPHPAKLVADGREVVIGVGTRRWVEAESTILSMSATRVEALDAEGRLLRVCAIDPEEAGAEDALAPAKRKAAAASGTELETVARLLVEAADNAAARQADAYRSAWDKLSELAALAFERLNSIEQAYQDLLDERRAAAEAEGGDGLGQALGSMVLQRSMQPTGPAKPGVKKGPANGSG